MADESTGDAVLGAIGVSNCSIGDNTTHDVEKQPLESTQHNLAVHVFGASSAPEPATGIIPTADASLNTAWSKPEDDILVGAVMKYGKNQWDTAATLLTGKSGEECRIRWYQCLDPAAAAGGVTVANAILNDNLFAIASGEDSAKSPGWSNESLSYDRSDRPLSALHKALKQEHEARERFARLRRQLEQDNAEDELARLERSDKI